MIQYVTRAKKNPKSGESSYYAQIAPVNPISQDELADYINDQTTVSKTDIKAILVALDNAFTHYLRLGMSVRLGNVGSFRPTISSAGQTAADKVSASDIKAVRVRFTMGSELRKEFKLDKLTFRAYALPDTAAAGE